MPVYRDEFEYAEDVAPASRSQNAKFIAVIAVGVVAAIALAVTLSVV